MSDPNTPEQQPEPEPAPPDAPQPQIVYVERPPGKFALFVRHRVTQVVAALVVGLLVGGGTVALVEHHAGPGISQHGGQHQFPRGRGDGPRTG